MWWILDLTPYPNIPRHPQASPEALALNRCAEAPEAGRCPRRFLSKSPAILGDPRLSVALVAALGVSVTSLERNKNGWMCWVETGKTSRAIQKT